MPHDITERNDQSRVPPHQKVRNLEGAIWAVIASALFTVMIALIKDLTQTLSLSQTLAIRQGIMLVAVVPLIVKGLPHSLKSKAVPLQIGRICAAVTAMMLGFTALQHLPLAEATAIGFARSFFITILAILVLKETVGIHRWSALVIGFIGVLITVGAGQGSTDILYGLMALGGSAFGATAMIIIRRLSTRDPAITIMTWHTIAIGLIMAGPAAFFWISPGPDQWIKLVGLGLVSVLAQASTIRAFKTGEAAFIASLDYTRLIFATCLGFILFGSWPSAQSWFGVCLITLAALYSLYREHVRKKQLTSEIAAQKSDDP